MANKDNKSKSLFGFGKSAAPAAARPAQAAAPRQAAPSADISARRPRNVSGERMVIPEGVTIEGSISGAKECEISGHIKGDINVSGILYLGAGGKIQGNVKAVTCKVEGTIEGNLDCGADLEVSQSGKLQSETVKAQNVLIQGNVIGNVVAQGVLKLGPASTINGDVRTKKLMMEEGAALNGKCIMGMQGQ